MKSFALALRFLTEILALVAVAVFAWVTFDGIYAWVGAIGLPILMVAVWGIFNVPGDPSRGGGAPVPISGLVRLLIEVVFFGFAVVALAVGVSLAAGLSFLCMIVVAYALLEDRLRWLLTQPSPRRR
jgi:hypothetical protein